MKTKIQEYLKENNIKFNGSIEQIIDITNNIDTIIDIELIENESDAWTQASVYKRVNDLKGYTVILDNDVLEFETIEDFSKYLIELEEEAENFILISKNDYV